MSGGHGRSNHARGRGHMTIVAARNLRVSATLWVVATLAAAGCGQAQRAAATSGRVPQHHLISRCRLELRYGGSSAAGGQVMAEVSVRNAGPTRCALDRYPEVLLRGSSGQTLRLRQYDGGDNAFPPTRVGRYLKPGSDARFWLAFAPLGAGGVSCRNLFAASMVVTFAPGVHGRLDGLLLGLSKANQPIGPCAHTGFNVSPVGISVG